MKILVTGASGFVGAPLVRELKARGHHVLECGRSSPNTCDLLDCTKTESFLESEKPQGLIHLAWETSHGSYWSSPANLRWVSASLHLLEAFAHFGGKRVLVTGTSAEYYWDGIHTLSEFNTPTVPNSLYGVSKNSLRQILETWAPLANISLGWARLFCPFGPGEKEIRLIPRVVKTLASGNTLEFDNGLLIRDFIHVNDQAEALADFFESPVTGPVNIATGEGTSIREIIEQISNVLDVTSKVRFGAKEDSSDLPLRVVADVRRLQQEVIWSPTKKIMDRIAEYCHSMS